MIRCRLEQSHREKALAAEVQGQHQAAWLESMPSLIAILVRKVKLDGTSNSELRWNYRLFAMLHTDFRDSQ